MRRIKEYNADTGVYRVVLIDESRNLHLGDKNITLPVDVIDEFVGIIGDSYPLKFSTMYKRSLYYTIDKETVDYAILSNPRIENNELIADLKVEEGQELIVQLINSKELDVGLAVNNIDDGCRAYGFFLHYGADSKASQFSLDLVSWGKRYNTVVENMTSSFFRKLPGGKLDSSDVKIAWDHTLQLQSILLKSMLGEGFSNDDITRVFGATFEDGEFVEPGEKKAKFTVKQQFELIVGISSTLKEIKDKIGRGVVTQRDLNIELSNVENIVHLLVEVIGTNLEAGNKVPNRGMTPLPDFLGANLEPLLSERLSEHAHRQSITVDDLAVGRGKLDILPYTDFPYPLFTKFSGLLIEAEGQVKALRIKMESQSGQAEPEDISNFTTLTATLKQLRKINIILGSIGGLSNKRLAEIHELSEARISQILSEIPSEQQEQ